MPLRRQCLARLASNPNLRCEVLVEEGRIHRDDHTTLDKDGMRVRWREQVAVYPGIDGNYRTRDGLTVQQALDDPTRALPVADPGIVSPTEYATAQALLNLAGVPEGARDGQVGGNHYRKYKIQPWDVIDEYGLDFYAGNALKYLLRDKKDRLEDLKKARHYLEKLIEVEEGKLRGQGTGDHEGSES